MNTAKSAPAGEKYSPFAENTLPSDLLEIMENTAIVSENALESITRAEIESLTNMGKRFPRSIEKFQRAAIAMACSDPETAGACFYSLDSRDKKKPDPIEGPSIRCAEICAPAWGNVRWGSRFIGMNDTSVTIQGWAHDTETGVYFSCEVVRNILTKEGKKYSNDLIAKTIAGGSAIARRNALLSIIPRVFVDQVWRAAQKYAVGDSNSISTRRQNAIAYFQRHGIAPERVCAKLGVAGVEDINLKHLEVLIGYKTAIRDGEVHFDDLFGPSPKQPGARATKPPQPAPEPAPEPEPNDAQDPGDDEQGEPKATEKPDGATVFGTDGEDPDNDVF